MKYFSIAISSLLALFLAATTSVKAIAQNSHGVKPIAIQPASATTAKPTPFQLVSLAYQGEYREQNIPGFAALISAYAYRQITALDVVKAAIAAKELTSDALTDRNYISAVDLQLFSLDRPN